MENLRELQAQARTLERTGQVAAAIELYARILDEPAADRDGGTWARVAGLQLSAGRDGDAAASYAAAADRYATAGLRNLALAQVQHALRIDESQPDLLLRFGRLAAAQGYRRDARHGFVEFAERAAAVEDLVPAADALREFLRAFPDDGAVRRRLSEITGEPVAVSPTEPERAGARSAATLPGLLPTSHDEESASTESSAASPPATGHAASKSGVAAPGETPVERLEGFEPTHSEEAYTPSGPPAGREATDDERESGGVRGRAGEADEEEPSGDGEEAEPLPLLGVSEEGPDATEDDVSAAEAEPLPLIGFAEAPPPPARTSEEALREARHRVEAEPESAAAWRELIDRLRETGDPSLERVLGEAEHRFAELGRNAEALEFVEALARLRPEETALQQRRVERALRAGDRRALVAAYLALAGRLEAELDTRRAQEALQRVLELDPSNEEARAALDSTTAAASRSRDYVDLGELILSGAPEEVTRFQVAIGDPTGDEESDFAEILALFRKKVSESLDPKDAASHYDLGLAFKEMGLLDDAIVHLQSGLRGGASPLATLEILGECFVLKGQTSLAARVFERATRLEGVGDSDLVGVLYGLARCQEEMGQPAEARGTLERVVAVDLSFRDAAERLQRLQSAEAPGF